MNANFIARSFEGRSKVVGRWKVRIRLLLEKKKIYVAERFESPSAEVR